MEQNNPTEQQIRTIAEYDGEQHQVHFFRLHNSTSCYTLGELTIMYSSNLVQLNRVWAKVYSELAFGIKMDNYEMIFFVDSYHTAIDTNNIPAACIAVAEAVEFLNSLK